MFENNKKIKKHKHTLNFFFFFWEKAYIEFEREVARVGVLMCFGLLWAENGKPLSYEGVFIHWRRQKKSPLRVLDIDSDLSGFLFNNSAIICFFNHICCNIACVSLGFFFFFFSPPFKWFSSPLSLIGPFHIYFYPIPLFTDLPYFVETYWLLKAIRHFEYPTHLFPLLWFLISGSHKYFIETNTEKNAWLIRQIPKMATLSKSKFDSIGCNFKDGKFSSPQKVKRRYINQGWTSLARVCYLS